MKDIFKFNFVPSQNFGDAFNAFYLKETQKKFKWTHHEIEKKIIAVGSILGIGSRPYTKVWGTGAMYKHISLPKNVNFLAVRGPETRKLVEAQGYNVDDIKLGDPALLLPRIYNPNDIEKTHKIGIIPHVVDTLDARDFLKENSHISAKLIDSNCGIKNMKRYINDVLSCEYIVSTSLHGLICAAAYGVPAVWCEVGNRLMGDGIKFKDFYNSIGINDIPKLTKFRDAINYIPDLYDIDKTMLDDLENCNPFNFEDDDYLIDESDQDYLKKLYPSGYNGRIYTEGYW